MLANYIHEIQDFKDDVPGRGPALADKGKPDLWFTPEFEGKRKKYALTVAIESQCDHGTVVNSLHADLKGMDLNGLRTSAIDLYLTDDRDEITHLFEVKTDQSTSSLYQAVGQAMLHGSVQDNAPRRILVLPGTVSAETGWRLQRLGISVLRYEWEGSRPVFIGLNDVLS
ncbi:MAG: hypothetical protein U0Q16_03385 [Bryobacteraceae bacterium]